MTIKELKDWLSELSPENDNLDVVYRVLTTNHGDGKWTAEDHSLVASGTDIDNSLVYFCDRETAEIISKNS